VREIREGEVILSVPSKWLINADTARSSHLGHVFQQLENLEDELVTLLFVIYERANPESVWRPYFDILPESFSSTSFFSFDELMEFEGTPLMDETIAAKEQIRTMQEELVPALAQGFPDIFTEEIFSFENFLWARALFDSRGIVTHVGGRDQTCLIPLAGMLNHNLRGQVGARRFDEGTQCFVMESLCSIPQGSQVFLCYGDFKNRELLQYYGFLDESLRDTMYMCIEPPSDDSVLEKMREYGLGLEHFLREDRLSKKLLAAVRMCVMDPSATRDPFHPLDIEDERLAMETLSAMLQGMLTSYPTTYEEDQEVLQEEGLSANQQAAIRYRMIQKKIVRGSLLLLEEIQNAAEKRQKFA
jgi:hypothetical protein